MSSHSKPKYNSNQNTLNYRLQRIATSVLVAGVAGTVAASRMARSFDIAANSIRVTQAPSNNIVLAKRTSNFKRTESAAAEMQHTQQLLNELVHQIRIAPASASADREAAIKRAREIARSLHVFDRISNLPTRQIADGIVLNMCASPGDSAVAFLSTSNIVYSGAGDGSLTISIAGNQGEHQFTIASGTTQANIINAINSFTNQTGVEASVAIENVQRIQMIAVDAGPDGLVHVRELDGPAGLDYIFAQPLGGLSLTDLKDYGKNAITLQAIQDNP